jgi:hypothetical protein
MKNLIFILAILISSVSFGQVTKTEVIEVDSTLTKDVLFANALSFFATTFKSANAVIQMKDPETGKVIGKGIVDNRDVTITISCKNGKYKYEILAEDKVKEIVLNVNSLGKPKANAGTTKATINIINGNPILDTNSIYFKYSNSLWSSYTYCYNINDKRHNPGIGTKMYYNKWKEEVNKELAILKAKYEERAKDDIAINFLIETLKEKMKTSDW